MLDNIIESNNVLPELRPQVSPYLGTFLELFKEQVKKHPNHPAIKFGNSVLTYQELDEKSDHLAQILMAKGVSKDQLVGLFLPRSIEYIVGIMGILKAGGAYVPMNPTDANERLEHILSDSSCEIVITKREFTLPSFAKSRLKRIDLNLKKLKETNFSPIFKIIPIDSLAYVIYTSGTTGKPKGVMIEHRNLFSFLNNFVPDIEHDDRVLQCMSTTCDASVGEIFPVLSKGATLILWKGKDFNVIRKERITYILLTPSMTDLIEKEDCHSLKNLTLGGERLEGKIVTRFPDTVNVYNGYGPTECTFAATVTKVTDLDKVHIGNRLKNTRLYVVDGNLRPLPEGEKGELLIGGEGVGRGYLNLKELTREKFIPNPFGEGRAYRTGDLVRWNQNRLEYHGRIDRQIKLRGFRLELDGVERVIESFKGVVRAHLYPVKGNLIAYVTPIDAPIVELANYLEKNLEDFARPYKIIPLESFPRSSSGKIDHKNLPIPTQLRTEIYNLPVEKRDIELAEIWRKILSPGSSADEYPISLDDNIFDLGATSLNILKLLHLLRKRAKSFKTDLEIIYKNPVLKDLSQSLYDLESHSTSSKQVVSRGELFLTILKVLPSTLYFVFGHQLSLYLFVICVFFNPILIIFYLTELTLFRPLTIGPKDFILYIKNNLGLDKLNFKSVEILEEFPIEGLKKHIFCLHPHGLTDIHIYPIEKHIFEKGLKYRMTFMKEMFFMPFLRTFLSLLGYIPAVEKSYSWAKKRNFNILTTPGDVPEFLASHHPLKPVLTPNLNFFKVALKNGMPLIPILAFNAHKSYKYYPLLFNYRDKLRYGAKLMPIQPFRGKWFLPIPFRINLKIVFGKPIHLDYKTDPTWEEVEQAMQTYKKSLQELFDRNAPKDYPPMEIV